MKQEVLISIVIPVYNASKYINECIDSILAQSYQHFEIIIVDDGSTDNSVEIIKSYTDDRIYLFCNTHNYIHSLNLGMNKAQGKYIARMDSDDIMLPNRLEMQYQYMEEHPEIDVCGGAARTLGSSEYDINISTSEKEIASNLIYGNVIIHPTVFMKQSLMSLFQYKDGIYEFYNPEYVYAEDYNLWVDLFMKGCRINNISEFVLNYRTGEHQVTSKKRVEMNSCSYRISVKYIDYLFEQMSNADDRKLDLFNNLIELHNEKIFSFDLLRKVTYILHNEFLQQR